MEELYGPLQKAHAAPASILHNIRFLAIEKLDILAYWQAVMMLGFIL